MISAPPRGCDRSDGTERRVTHEGIIRGRELVGEHPVDTTRGGREQNNLNLDRTSNARVCPGSGVEGRRSTEGKCPGVNCEVASVDRENRVRESQFFTVY
jgi:hypothetical protein